ncbi:nuclease-related domain-containing protein [Neobacillus mesonae]|uniref:nuclease-related domain-containing protein n=1 Tax=Neobacillus mesonae TaxID=1193713 RepID=UPI00203D2F6A|nr:nuclease-related domain-containing protein [Neobacillus mesonae]MCM3567910.1 NERD domain-containing protein [Neobacillus mesonae]
MSRLLHARMEFSEQDKWNYLKLEKGLQGELKFDKLVDEGLKNDCIVIKGLLLEADGNEFQIDMVIIFQGVIYLVDVKNFEGDYYFESGKIYLLNGNIIKDPHPQLMRCESLFIKLLQKLRIDFPVESRLVFINPEFTLLQAPLDYPITHPSQVKRLIKKWNTIPSKLNKTHERLANQLISLHKPFSSHMRVPQYEYGRLKKGMMCNLCLSLSTFVNGNHLVCKKCGHHEIIDAAVLRCVKELVILFPGIRITTNGVFEWCGIVKSKKMLGRILKENYKAVGYGQWTYYIPK